MTANENETLLVDAFFVSRAALSPAATSFY